MQTDYEKNLFSSLNQSCGIYNIPLELKNTLRYRLNNFDKCIQCIPTDLRVLIERVRIQHSLNDLYDLLPTNCSSCATFLIERNLDRINWVIPTTVTSVTTVANSDDDSDDDSDDVPDLVYELCF